MPPQLFLGIVNGKLVGSVWLLSYSACYRLNIPYPKSNALKSEFLSTNMMLKIFWILKHFKFHILGLGMFILKARIGPFLCVMCHLKHIVFI